MSVNQISTSTRSIEQAVQGLSGKSPLSSAADFAADILGGAARTARNIAVGEASVSGDFQELISWQIAVQEELQSTSMISNIEKSRHETRMAPIRNIRVG